MPPPRLAHLTTTDMSLDWLLGPQLRAFAAAGYEVIGISAPGSHVHSLRAAGIDHVALTGATRAWSPTADLRAGRQLHAVLRSLRPDILHTHNPKPGVYGRLVGRAAGVPVVVNTVHGLYATPDDPRARRAVVYGLERLAASCSDAELVQNPEDLATLAALGVPDAKLVLLGNGIDLARFDRGRLPAGTRERLRAELGIGEEEVVIGAVGRLVAEKGYHELFAAAVHLRHRLPGARLVVIGPDDPSKPDAVSVADRDEATRAAGVRFLGRRDDVDELYAAMDCYVLASHREGYPRSAMEAAAMGLPVVATDIRGCRQVVDDGVTGLLVPPRDPAGLAEALAVVAGDPTLRRRMGEAAVARARRHFDQQAVIDTTLATYERLLAARRR